MPSTSDLLHAENKISESTFVHCPETVANCPYDAFAAVLLGLNENECHSAMFNLRGNMAENIRRIKHNPNTEGARAIVSGIRFFTYCSLPDLPELA